MYLPQKIEITLITSSQVLIPLNKLVSIVRKLNKKK